MDAAPDPTTRAAQLDCWSGPVDPQPVDGGLTNLNFVVRDAGEAYFVRIAEDNPVHGIMRFNELAAARAAAEVGISPAILHAEEGVIVSKFIDGSTLTPADVADPTMLGRIVPLITACHREVPRFMAGAVLMFWPFHVIRGYVASGAAANRAGTLNESEILERVDELEDVVGPIEIVFAHNDLLAANMIDDGEKLWLVDWEYAGFNSPLFDLAGLATNNALSHDAESDLLHMYFGSEADTDVWRRFDAMKCVSLLREALWSMVSETHSTLNVDFAAYTATNVERFEHEYDAFSRSHHD